jgi:hypothetical protein
MVGKPIPQTILSIILVSFSALGIPGGTSLLAPYLQIVILFTRRDKPDGNVKGL